LRLTFSVSQGSDTAVVSEPRNANIKEAPRVSFGILLHHAATVYRSVLGDTRRGGCSRGTSPGRGSLSFLVGRGKTRTATDRQFQRSGSLLSHINHSYPGAQQIGRIRRVALKRGVADKRAITAGDIVVPHRRCRHEDVCGNTGGCTAHDRPGTMRKSRNARG